MKEKLKISLICSLAGLVGGIVFYLLGEVTILGALLASLMFTLGCLLFDLMSFYIDKIKNKGIKYTIVGIITLFCIVSIIYLVTDYDKNQKIDYKNAELVIGEDTLNSGDTVYFDKYTSEEIKNAQIIYDEEINR
jgi:hypothetical protein